MVFQGVVNKNFLLDIILSDANAGAYPSIFIFDALTGETLVQRVDLSSVSGSPGLYVGTCVSGLDVGVYPYLAVIYDDPARTTAVNYARDGGEVVITPDLTVGTISGLQAQIAAMQVQINQLLASVSGMSVQVSGMDADVVGLQVIVGGLSSEVSGLSADIIALQVVDSLVSGQVAALVSGVNLLNANLGAVVISGPAGSGVSLTGSIGGTTYLTGILVPD